MKRISKTRRRPITEIERLRIGLSLVWLFVLLLLLFTNSCTQTDVEEDIIPPHALKEVDAGFNLNVLATRTPVTRSITFTPNGAIESDTPIVGEKDSLQTKATASLTEEQESQIESLWVGQYDADTGTRLFSQYIASMTGTTVNLKLKQNKDGSKSHIYFVSNAGDLGEISNEATLLKHTLAYVSTEAGLPKDNLCKMMGMWDGKVVSGGVKDVTVEMTRLLAKITFAYSIGEGFKFTPTSVELKNAPTISQVKAPDAQLTTGGISYKTYTSEADVASTTVYWYLPENMAGTVSGDNAVDSKKKKIGTGVTNATCIELTGDAVQGGVTYKNVTFHFYPGSDMNNYDIIRNTHYTLTVSLVGIDVSDERITVGEIPDIEIDPTEMPAKKGSEKEIQITARPGQEWVLDMPDWLSALLDGEEISPNATISHQGPATVVFKSVKTNPKAESRKASFEIDMNNKKQELTITQSGSSLTKGTDVSLKAEAASEGSSSFTATEGLQWLATLSDGDGWLDWSASQVETSGTEALEGEQILKVKSVKANPLAQPRNGKIVVRAGASVGNADYNGLKQEINVEQAASTVTGSTVTVIAEAGMGESSFSGTAGLEWTLSIADGSWISLTSPTSGKSTTGSAQQVIFSTTVNPSSAQRSNDIIVRIGDRNSGPTGKITVNQKGSSLTASITPATVLSATAGVSGTYKLKGTKDLPYSFVAGFPSWLTVTDGTASTGGGYTTGTDQDLTYKTLLNPYEKERTATISVKAGNMTKDVVIKQEGSKLSTTNGAAIIAADGGTTLGSVTATSGLSWTITPATSNGITISPTKGMGDAILTFTGEAHTGSQRTGLFTVMVDGTNDARTATVAATQATYIPAYVGNIQVCKTDEEYCDWLVAANSCGHSKEGKKDWRLPSYEELQLMYNNRSSLQAVSGFIEFWDNWYWSSTSYIMAAYRVIDFSTGNFSDNNWTNGANVRCVRTK